MSDAPEQALALLRKLGIPPGAGKLYVVLLGAGAVRLCDLGEEAKLSSSGLAQAVDYLKLFRLVSQDIQNGEIVLFATNPRNAWKAHDAYFYWARSLHVGDIEDLPPLPEMRDQDRRRCYAQLDKICGSIYDLNVKAHDPLRHRHREIQSAEIFSSWLAIAIAAAKLEISAVELPPLAP